MLENTGFTPEDWITEAQSACIDAERASQSHRSNDYLVAGIRTSASDRSPPNFAWVVPEKPKRVMDFNNVHTEYRDNFHIFDTQQVVIE